MSLKKKVLDRCNQTSEITVDKDPDTCPVCHQGISSVPFGNGHLIEGSRQVFCWIPFICPREACDALFIACYSDRGPGSLSDKLHLRRCFPNGHRPTQFPQEVSNISSQFVEIYNQASQAESEGLNHICGPGYRKSLEFLIKDYLIHHKRIDEETIKKKFLGNCINDDIQDANIKTCASRAAWLGNDETHYLRTWEKQDIDDLKILINLTVNWIQNEVLTERYRQVMPR